MTLGERIQTQHTSLDEHLSREESVLLDLSFSKITDVLDNKWSVSALAYRLVEFLGPRTHEGFERIHWRCSCGTIMWEDFRVGNWTVFYLLKRRLRNIASLSAHKHNSNTTSRSSGGTSQSHPRSPNTTAPCTTSTLVTTPMMSQGGQSSGQGSSSANPHLDTTSTAGSHTITIDSQKFFEVCVDTNMDAIEHHEIDISNVKSDAELFRKIWNSYTLSRGNGFRGLLLQPRDVHFVKFAINRRVKYGTHIDQRPDVFPPDIEIQEKRYAYETLESSTVRMPEKTFRHYLRRAKQDEQLATVPQKIWVWLRSLTQLSRTQDHMDWHQDDTWLGYLPKKLEISVLAMPSQGSASTPQSNPSVDRKLAFGWGIHILHGPNHMILWQLLLIGVVISFLVSCMIVGIAKTQEQGFGVGSYLLAIVIGGIPALYFTITD